MPKRQLLSNLEGSWACSETGVDAGGKEFSLVSSSSIRIKFSAFKPISNSLEVQSAGGMSIQGRKTVTMFNSGFSQ